MTNQVNLTSAEIARIQSAVNTQAPNGVGMYADAYRMVVQIDNEHRAAGLPTLDAGTRNWFEKAIEINENDPTSTGNSFVRTVTVAGLVWDIRS